jgi:transposase InsO family protein
MNELQAIRSHQRWRVRHRLAVLRYAKEHSQKAASDYFGLSARTIRRWTRRYEAGGVLALVPRYTKRRRSRLTPQVLELIRHARTVERFGCTRTRLWLQRVHQISLAAHTIHRAFHRLELPRLSRTPKRRPRQLRLFAKEEPGDSVQIDVKFVKIQGRQYYQYTAIDDCTRYRVLRLYRRLDARTSLAFWRVVQQALPFRIRQVQCDRGTEFPLAFRLAVEEAGMRHRYIKPRRPQQNGKVERSHRIDDDEFWTRHQFTGFDDAERALEGWEHRYNTQRFSLALAGCTPAEVLATKLTARLAARASTPLHPPPGARGASASDGLDQFRHQGQS